jgi:hypothetical protein
LKRELNAPKKQPYRPSTAPSALPATLPNAPRNKVNAGLDYTHGLPVVPLDADLNITSVWQSGRELLRHQGSIQARLKLCKGHLHRAIELTTASSDGKKIR